MQGDAQHPGYYQIVLKTNDQQKKPQQPTKQEGKKPIQVTGSSEVERMKSKTRQIIIGLIISLSAVMFGYSLKEITSVPKAKIVQEYGITINTSLALSLLIGILPLGSVFGSIITKLLISKYRRLAGIYIFTVFNIIAIVLVNITTFETLIVGRFIQGICVGYYSAISPVYLKEIAPKELRRLLGLFFSLGKIVGVIIVIIIELIFEVTHVQIGWRIILSMTALFSIMQALLIYFFGSDTPTQMIEKGEIDRAREIIKDFYKEEYVQEVLDEYVNEFQMEKKKGAAVEEEIPKNQPNQIKTKEVKVNKRPQQIEMTQMDIAAPANLENTLAEIVPTNQKVEESPPGDTLTYDQKKNYAYCLGIHLCVIRHFTGGNAIISQGGIFITTFDPTLGHYTSLIINLVQFAFVILGLVIIQKLVGKRPLFLFSITFLSFINIGLAIAMYYQNLVSMMFLMCLFMIIYGGAFISPIWAYPSEIIPASQSMIPNIFHWLALAVSTLVPPIITGIMPGQNPYPVFIFFGLYGFLGLAHVFRYLRESDGFTYSEIIKSFK